MPSIDFIAAMTEVAEPSPAPFGWPIVAQGCCDGNRFGVQAQEVRPRLP
ncbi:MAG: hypothetical protein WBX38_20705 [Candidatus Sulfotelmatobacter sp.]